MDFIFKIDLWLFNLLHESISSSTLDVILIPLRNPYVWAPLYVFAIFFILFNFKNKAYWFLLFSLLTVSSSDLISSRVVKPLVERQRPCSIESELNITAKVHCGSGYSFTSTHASNHFAIALFFILTIGKVVRYLGLGLIIWASLISIAQVYVGVHYPSDIIAGAILGLTIGYFWSYVYNKYYGLYQ